MVWKFSHHQPAGQSLCCFANDWQHELELFSNSSCGRSQFPISHLKILGQDTKCDRKLIPCSLFVFFVACVCLMSHQVDMTGNPLSLNCDCTMFRSNPDPGDVFVFDGYPCVNHPSVHWSDITKDLLSCIGNFWLLTNNRARRLTPFQIRLLKINYGCTRTNWCYLFLQTCSSRCFTCTMGHL